MSSRKIDAPDLLDAIKTGEILYSAEERKRGDWGGPVEYRPGDAPVSRALEQVEHRIGGLLFDEEGRPKFDLDARDGERETFEATVRDNPPGEMTLQASYWDKPRVLKGGTTTSRQVGLNQTAVIPPDVSAAMRLTDYYTLSNGDVWETIEIPIDILVRPVQVEGADQGMVDFYEQMFSPPYLNIDSLTPQIALETEMYGSSYPFEIWDGRVPDDDRLNMMARKGDSLPFCTPQKITTLNPRFIFVGAAPFGGNVLQMVPVGEEGYAFRQQILEDLLPPMTYNALAYDIHDYLLWGWNIPLDPGACIQIRDKAPSWVRYPWPRLTRSFRTISTRQVLEEMTRATIEGMKNQLWAFLLGDPTGKIRPSPDEIRALTGVVNGLAGARTQSIVWGGHLRIEVHAPQVDPQLANERWQRLTEHIFRERGISMNVVSGETPSTSGGGGQGTDGIDVKVLIERMTYRRTLIHTYLARLVRKIALLSNSGELIKAALENKLPVARMADHGIETESLVKNLIGPMYQMGLVSPQTALKKTGFNYDHELANHKAADKEELTPPATFAQATVNPQGETTTHSKSGGNGGDHGAARTSTAKGRRTGTGSKQGPS